MKIQQVQPNTTFQRKEGLLSVSAHNNLKQIAQLMKEANSFKIVDDLVSIHILERLEVYKDQKPFAHLINCNSYRRLSNFSYRCSSDFNDDIDELLLHIGKKTVKLNRYNGSYDCEKKPFFKSWKSYIKSIEKLLAYILANYDHTQIVQKRFLDKSNLKFFKSQIL